MSGEPVAVIVATDRVSAVDPDPRERTVADLVLARFDEPLLYARVDTIVQDDRVLLMELEVIEPVLFFTKAPGSAERMAGAIAARLG